jgi:hypothetical protein
VHRAIASGVETLGAARQFQAGALAASQVEALPLLNRSEAGNDSGLVAIRKLKPLRAGIYGNAEQLIALNRPLSEDVPAIVPDESLRSMFAGLDYQVIQAELGNDRSLASEIWRFFIVAMVIAMLVEAWLCLPERPSPKPAAQETVPGGRIAA